MIQPVYTAQNQETKGIWPKIYLIVFSMSESKSRKPMLTMGDIRTQMAPSSWEKGNHLLFNLSGYY